MEYVTVQGHRVPALGLGTWQLRGRECRRAVEVALDVGYRHLDTAQAYANEGEVGAALASSGVDRGDVFLTTKIDNFNHAPDRVVASTEESLRRLGTDHVDLLLVHWPGDPATQPATLEAMTGLRDAGKTVHIGVSNFPPALMAEAIAQAPVFCNQVELHPFLAQTDVLELARRHDVLVAAYSPLAKGRVVRDPILRAIADAHGKNPAQVTLRWLLDIDGVCAIPKSADPQRIADNLAVFDFALRADERRRIAGLARGERLVDPPFAPDWGSPAR